MNEYALSCPEFNLEPGRTPIDELDGAFRLDGSDGGVDVLGYDVATVQHAASHVFPVTRVALNHLIGRLETRLRARKCGVGGGGG